MFYLVIVDILVTLKHSIIITVIFYLVILLSYLSGFKHSIITVI